MPAVYDAWRLAERFHFQSLDAFLAAHPDGGDLTEMFAYLHRDDEVQLNRLIYVINRAIVQAFGGSNQPVEEKEPVWDTTDPEFAKNFRGFI